MHVSLTFEKTSLYCLTQQKIVCLRQFCPAAPAARMDGTEAEPRSAVHFDSTP